MMLRPEYSIEPEESVPAASVSRVISFGPFNLHLETRLLLEGDQPLRLGSRALDILIALIEKAGERVSKDELIARAWPNSTVEEANLRVHVSVLRRALADGRNGNRYILTDAGRGYRFTAPVTIRTDTSTAALQKTAYRHNLPATLTRLIGRTDTVNMLTEEMSRHRLLTLVGSGGVGKTSVALAVAEALLPYYQDGIWLTDLSSISDPRSVPGAVATVLGLNQRNEDLQGVIMETLKGKQVLLVFDNCDHVIDAVAAVVPTVLKEAFGVRILATSREPLDIEGEHVRRLQPLATPPTTVRLTAARALSFSAVQLFVERATARLHSFELRDEDAPTLARICSKLDGIPLAIEFAAARVDAFGVGNLDRLLDDRLRLLTMGRRATLSRHQTMQATLDWSYEVLNDRERLMFERLAVFAGRFPLEAACKIAADDEVSYVQVGDCVANLVAKSLVTADTGGNLVLYRLLETTRVYAREKLSGSGSLELLSRRHAEYYRDLLAGNEAGWGVVQKAEKINKNRYCIDDIRAALDWAFSPTGDRSIGIVLTAAAVPLWMEMSLMAEARERAERALLSVSPGDDPRLEMRLHAALGTSSFFAPESSGFATAASRVLELADSLDDTEYQLGALWRLWSYRAVSGEYRSALSLAQKYRAVAVRKSRSADQAVGDRLIGISHRYLGDQVEAKRYLEAMLENYDASASKEHLERFQLDQRVGALAQLARVLWLLGRPDGAAETAERAVREASTINHANSKCYALAVAACPIALSNGNLIAAEGAVADLTGQASEHRMALWNAWATAYKGSLYAQHGDYIGGIKYLRQALDEFQGGGYFVPLLEFQCELAKTLYLAGQVADGLSVIEEALSRATHTDERWCMSELLRIKGELILLERGVVAVEDIFGQSIGCAERQGTLSWRLRTAVSLARLWAKQGRAEEARSSLSAIYHAFDEGLLTSDLVEAKKLIDELG